MDRKTKKHIKCADCMYAQRDKKASEHGWIAYECTNFESEFHKALLNVTRSGDKQKEIMWPGCVFGERRV